LSVPPHLPLDAHYVQAELESAVGFGCWFRLLVSAVGFGCWFLLLVMAEVNGAKSLVSVLSSPDKVAGWAAQAATLPRVVSH